MKKFLMILAGAALLLLLTGCECEPASAAKAETPFFVDVGSYRLGSYAYGDIVYQRDTKVMYAVSRVSDGGGGVLTLLVNADGSPMLWEVDG
jgi:hypothetical protein